MPVRVPASEIYKIMEEDLRGAITMFRERALPVTFEDSTRFDLLVDGYRRFPPKVIIALAAQRPLGSRVLVGRVLGRRIIDGVPFDSRARVRVHDETDEGGRARGDVLGG